jgi:TctA family transporter
MLEENFRRTMLLYNGDFAVFVTRPISATLVACAAVLLVYTTISGLRARTKSATASGSRCAGPSQSEAHTEP